MEVTEKKRSIENWLLLTATIKPMAGANATLRADPLQRLNDYEEALRFYLNIPNMQFDGIFFLENSGFDLATLKAIANNENPHCIPVKFFSALSDCNPSYGKGHSELQLMDRAFKKIIEPHYNCIRFWKLTGRIKVPNICKLISTAPKDFGVYIDLRLTPRWLSFFGTDKWADTRIIGFSVNGYSEHFFGKKSIVGTTNDKHSHVVELALFPILYRSWKNGESIEPRFTTQPVMIGVGAESLKNYNDLTAKLKNFVRSIARKLYPRLWI